MIVNVTGARISTDGVYGHETTVAVRNFQTVFELSPTGDADHETRQLLRYLDAGRSSAQPAWPVPSIGSGGADGCQVAVIGDSLMAGSSSLHERALRTINCASAIDGVGGRSLSYGWQCRVAQPGGGHPLLLLPEAEPGNDTCAPSGLTLLAHWGGANALGDIVVVALGTNDAGLYSESTWVAHWNEALHLAGNRPVIFVTTIARAGSTRTGQQNAYAGALRRWCDARPRCHLADWALTPAASDPANYVDSVHLRSAGTQARADFIAAAVRALFDGDPIPNPRPLPTATTATTTTTTTTTTATTAVTTTTNVPTTSTPPGTTTTSIATTTSTTTGTTTTTLSNSTTTTSTVAPTSTTTTTTVAPTSTTSPAATTTAPG